MEFSFYNFAAICIKTEIKFLLRHNLFDIEMTAIRAVSQNFQETHKIDIFNKESCRKVRTSSVCKDVKMSACMCIFLHLLLLVANRET